MSTGGWGGQQAPAGWYPDPASGAPRWWDGARWGGFAPAQPAAFAPAGYLGGFVPTRPGTNGFAIASLVCGVTFICGLTAPVAVVLGHVALHQIKRTGEGGRGLAIAGLVLGYLAVALWIVLIVVSIVNGSSSSTDTSGSTTL